MANKKRKGGKGGKGGGGKGGQGSRYAQDRSQHKTPGHPAAQKKNAGGASEAGSKQATKSGSTGKTSGQKQKLTGSARRAAQRKAAKRKRQMMTVWAPIAVIAVIVVAALSLGGGPKGGGKVSSSGQVKVDGPALNSELKPGEEVPSFSAPELNGGTVSWEPGTPTVLTIWAAWCPHCQVELPILDKVKDSYPEVETVSIVTAQGDQPGPTPEDFVKKNDITMRVAVDDNGQKLMKAMGVQGFPTLYFINADGTVLRQSGGEPSEAELSAGYDELAAQVSAPEPTPQKDE